MSVQARTLTPDGAVALVGTPVGVTQPTETADAPELGPFHNHGLASLRVLSSGICDCCGDCPSCCLAFWCFCCWFPWRIHANLRRVGYLDTPCGRVDKRQSYCWAFLGFLLTCLWWGSEISISVWMQDKFGPFSDIRAMTLVGLCVGTPANKCDESHEFVGKLLEIGSFAHVERCYYHQKALYGCNCHDEEQQEIVNQIMSMNCKDLDQSPLWISAGFKSLCVAIALMSYYFILKKRYAISDSPVVVFLKACCCQFCFFMQLCRHIDHVSGHLPLAQMEVRQPLMEMWEVPVMGTVVTDAEAATAPGPPHVLHAPPAPPAAVQPFQ